jgi:quinolinate synthase
MLALMSIQPFPSLLVSRDRLTPLGSFAEAQAMYLSPDPETVATLDRLARAKNVGIVAHYYMDPELQGVLARLSWSHVWISDSLLMADQAVKMAQAGVKRVVVLGVDFMSENARAMLDAGGFPDVPVYRVAADPIGCSLASAADSLTYSAWLEKASRTPRSVHVVYINTSLLTKARAHAKVPTVTCTSSNVLATVLDAFASIEGGHVFFGPDTYMGRNLERILTTLANASSDDEVRALHPKHTRATVKDALSRFHYFEQGNCIVHHMFGEEVVAEARKNHPDAFVTAHLEVPGEMFELALEKKAEGRGAVGSTSDILGFITKKIREASAIEGAQKLSFLLGTEAGMITSIVREVQRVLGEAGRDDVVCEIVFPVAAESMTVTPDSPLAMVPGVSGGEGCTTAGGCATCPYMKMNSLDALISLCERFDVEDDDRLKDFYPNVYAEEVAGRKVAELGGVPILHMRAFQKEGRLPAALIEDVLSR